MACKYFKAFKSLRWYLFTRYHNPYWFFRDTNSRPTHETSISEHRKLVSSTARSLALKKLVGEEEGEMLLLTIVHQQPDHCADHCVLATSSLYAGLSLPAIDRSVTV